MDIRRKNQSPPELWVRATERHQQRLLPAVVGSWFYWTRSKVHLCVATSAVAILVTLTPTAPALPRYPAGRPGRRCTVHDCTPVPVDLGTHRRSRSTFCFCTNIYQGLFIAKQMTKRQVRWSTQWVRSNLWRRTPRPSSPVLIIIGTY